MRNLLLTAETTVHEKWLPSETARVILLLAETRQEAKSLGQSLQEAIHQAQQSQQEAKVADSLGGSQVCRTVSAGSVN